MVPLTSRALLAFVAVFFASRGSFADEAPDKQDSQAATTDQPTLPKPKGYVAPVYPKDAEKAGLTATVVLELDIDRDGRVKKARVVLPVGHGFDEAAIEAAQKLEFEPARKPDGTPFAARIRYQYNFTLTEVDRPVQEKKMATLSGMVLLADSDASLAGAKITIGSVEHPKDPSLTALSDERGAFSVPGLSEGTYSVLIEAEGYEPLSLRETLEAGETLDVKYSLAPKVTGLEVIVRGKRPPREVTRRTVEKREIDRIPGTNGDALRAIQNLPGVARPPGLAGLLLVRGSAPQDTQTFIDGTPVPLIYHFGGLSSVVPTEILDRIDFYPGNFSSQYGRVMGGIVDAGFRSPKTDGYHGLVQLDLIDARGLFEGPIPFAKNWSFLAAARRSYVDVWLGPVLEGLGSGVTQAPVYYDYQLLAETRPTQASNFRAAFFGSDDGLELLVRQPAPGEPAVSGNVGLHTGFKRLQVRYENELNPKTEIRSVLALGQDNIDFGLGPFYFLLDYYSATGRLELSRRLARGIRMNIGGDVFSGSYHVEFRAPAPPRPGEPPNQPFSTRSTEQATFDGEAFIPAGYVELELTPNARTKFVPGVRVDYANYTDRVDVSPRVNGRYDIVPGFPRTTAKGGIGLFAQPPQFQEVLEPIGTSGLKSNQAMHYSLGLEQDLSRDVEVSLEGYYKKLHSLVVQEPGFSGATVEYSNDGYGRSFGTEFLLKYKPDARFFGWLAYTLSRSTRIDAPGKTERPVTWDQTHILTMLGSYRLGHGWEFGARFRLVSGNLTTPNVCLPSPDCDPNRTNGLLHAPSGVYTAIPLSTPNSERLPLFHQLDLRVDKRWSFKSFQLSAYLDVQNAYNHANVEGIAYNYNYTARQWVTGLPLLPSIGVRGDF